MWHISNLEKNIFEKNHLDKFWTKMSNVQMLYKTSAISQQLPVISVIIQKICLLHPCHFIIYKNTINCKQVEYITTCLESGGNFGKNQERSKRDDKRPNYFFVLMKITQEKMKKQYD